MAAVTNLPPGLQYDGPLEEIAVGGVSEQWADCNKVKLYTNAFIIQNDSKVLLGLKKRGFGLGLWNGFGGKVDPGETPREAAIRELQEEAGILAPLEHCGVLLFTIDDVESAFHIDLFRSEEYTDTITETDEMRPAWFSVQKELLPPDHTSASESTDTESLPPIPLAQMWADDEFWMPAMFARRPFVGRADFSADNKMRKWWFGAAPPAAK